MKLRLLFTLLIVYSFGFAQKRTCASVEKMELLRQNPQMNQKYEKYKTLFEVNLNKLKEDQRKGITRRAAVLRIPVAIHYPGAKNLSASEMSCLRNLAQNQIDILNADFNATNADLSTWTNTTSPYFSSVNFGSISVQFEIATNNHPASTGLTDGQPAITFGKRFGGGPDGDWDPDWAGYMNFVVETLTNRTLGYAYLGSSPADGSAVYITSTAFGSGSGCAGFTPEAPYNLGRTLTHEMGHYLNLMHIWGDANCGDDFVADTPVHDTSNGGCPPIDHLSTCAGTPRELTMNYMDYTYDECMYMLTEGQAQRMQAHLNTIQADFNQATLSKKDQLFEKEISIYPNPNKGSFNIQLSNNLTKYSVEVIDQAGRVVYQRAFENQNGLEQTVNMNAVSTGVYFVKIKADNAVGVKKIIIE